jgi:mannose-6-phosphate isomerase
MQEKLPSRTEKPWGHEILFALTPIYAGKMIFVKQGHRLSLQYHSMKDESMYIYEGEVKMEIDGKIRTLRPGDCIHIPPLTKHRLQSVKDTLLVEVSTPELSDVTRLADDYGREDK